MNNAASKASRTLCTARLLGILSRITFVIQRVTALAFTHEILIVCNTYTEICFIWYQSMSWLLILVFPVQSRHWVKARLISVSLQQTIYRKWAQIEKIYINLRENLKRHRFSRKSRLVVGKLSEIKTVTFSILSWRGQSRCWWRLVKFEFKGIFWATK